MKVLLITQTLSAGGSERTIAKISKLYAESCNVFLLIIDESKSVDFEHAGTLLFLKDYLENQPPSFLNKVKAMRRIKKSFSINVSISFLEGPNFTNILSRLNDKVYVSVRGHKSSFYKKGGYKWWIEKFSIRMLYNFSNGVVAASKGIAEDLATQLGVDKKRIRTIPNYYDFKEIIEKSKESAGAYEILLNEHKVIIANGRLSIPKGYHHLLKIFYEMKKIIPDLKLMILGDGELYQELINKANDYGLNLHSWKDEKPITSSYDVYLTGFVKNPFSFLARASLFAFTSLWEGFPNALAEAIICKVPVVSSDCMSGPREILFDNLSYREKVNYPVSSQYGLLLPPFKIEGETTAEVYEVWVRNIAKQLEVEKSFQRATNFEEKFGKGAVSILWLELVFNSNVKKS